MKGLDEVQLLPWYLNTRRIGIITATTIGAEAQRSITENSEVRVDQMAHGLQIAQAIIAKIPDLTAIAMQRDIAGDRIFASVWGLFSFGEVSAAFRQAERGQIGHTGRITGTIPLGETSVSVEGRLHLEHVFSFSSLGSLSGRKRAYVAGMFEITEDGEQAVIEPYIIGEFSSEMAVKPELKYRWPQSSRIYITELQEFAKAARVKAPTEEQLKVMRRVPEQEVKNAFAEIAGQPYVPKDWGGEKSDLYVNRLMLGEDDDVKLVSAAFAFKGPAIFRPMHPADLGKRGDQLLRLFEEPADIMVLQHCHKIETTVIREMEALAARVANPKLYCVVDGADTYRVLKAFGYFERLGVCRA